MASRTIPSGNHWINVFCRSRVIDRLSNLCADKNLITEEMSLQLEWQVILIKVYEGTSP